LSFPVELIFDASCLIKHINEDIETAELPKNATKTNSTIYEPKNETILELPMTVSVSAENNEDEEVTDLLFTGSFIVGLIPANIPPDQGIGNFFKILQDFMW